MNAIPALPLIAVPALPTLAMIVWWYFFSPPPKLPPLLNRMIEVGTLQRSYLVHVPAKLPKGAPVVFVLHGTGQNADGIRRSTGGRFDELGQKHGFVVVYPEGLSRQWNDCRRKSARYQEVDDVAFVRAVVADLASAYGTDPDETFLFGLSNGGHMVLRLVGEYPEAFAGAATVGANLPTSSFDLCQHTGATPPLLMAQGMRDPVAPYKGGKVTVFGLIDRGMSLSAEQTANTLAHRNECEFGGSTTPTTDVERKLWRKDGRIWIELLIFKNGGHVVPQPVYRYPRVMGPTPSFDLPAHVVGFFGLGDERPI